MYFHKQNLTDGRLPMFWHGRAWLAKDYKSRNLRIEWSLGKFARDFAISLTFGCGDDDSALQLHVCVPWVFSIFLTLDGVYRCKECRTGIAIHNSGFWWYPLSWENETRSDDPWWRKWHCWRFPWEWEWVSTDVLTHGPNNNELGVLYTETHKDRHKKRLGWTDTTREKIEFQVSRKYPYAYILKNRTIQQRTATVHVERMTWRRRWWWLIPGRKIRTYIDVRFDKEVGEGEGSWKGGCLGCSYEMKWDETPERCLSRMEHEREFRR